MKNLLWLVALLPSLPACYTTLAAVDQDADSAPPVQRIEVEHRLVDPWCRGLPWYGYGFYSGAYLYDPYYRYYYSDPWWYTPPAEKDPHADYPTIGSLGDSPPLPPGARQSRSRDPNSAASRAQQQRRKRPEKRRRATRGTLDDAPSSPRPANPRREQAADDP